MRVAILTASAMKKTIDGEDFSGKCITGLDLDNNRIVRFVRNRYGAPVENPYCDRLQPLSVYDVRFIDNCPLACQTENVIAEYRDATCLGNFEGGIDALYKQYQKIKLEDSSFLLDGSYKLTDISPFKHSLEIIKASNIQLDGKKASFRYRGKGFRFVSVTDLAYKGVERVIDQAFLIISIPTEDFDGKGFFKFIAALYPIE